MMVWTGCKIRINIPGSVTSLSRPWVKMRHTVLVDFFEKCGYYRREMRTHYAISGSDLPVPR